MALVIVLMVWMLVISFQIDSTAVITWVAFATTCSDQNETYNLY